MTGTRLKSTSLALAMVMLGVQIGPAAAQETKPASVAAPVAEKTQAEASRPAPSPTELPPIAKLRKSFDAKLLEPVAGIDYRTYGHAAYAMFRDPDGDQDAILGRLGLTKARFEEANTVFADRMAKDPTFAMVEMFGAYFNETAEGTYSALGRDVARSVLEQVPLTETEPMPEEKFRDIQIFYGRKASVAGTELAKQDKVLKPQGITFNDFNIIGAWFSRRLALQSEPVDYETLPRAEASVPTQHPEWGGLWRFAWKTMKRTGEGMEVADAGRDICVRQDMTAETLPLMPKPAGGKCVLVHLNFYDTAVQMRAQCDHGEYGTSWSMFLEPKGDGAYAGQISYNETNENDEDLPQPTTEVTAQRIGDCP